MLNGWKSCINVDGDTLSVVTEHGYAPKSLQCAVVNPNGRGFVGNAKTRCVRVPLPERRLLQSKEIL